VSVEAPELPGDPALDGPSFVAAVVGHPGFRAAGVGHGRSTGSRWAVVDPDRHPLRVWQRSSRTAWSYARSARALDAALFTNGPMMGRRLPGGRKVTRSWVPVEFALWTATGAAAGAATGIAMGRGPHRRHGVLAGAAAGVAVAWRRSFTGWVPCGRVHGQAGRIDDGRDFDGEGRGHAWLGRTGHGFAGHRIGDGDLPSDVEEGTGGLIRLVHDHRVVSRHAGHPDYRRDFAKLSDRPGVVAWGLVPTGPDTGVLVVLGDRRMPAASAAYVLHGIGARDAVATDLSGSVLMGSGTGCLLPRPSLPRQSMQLYGLCCP
jgi:hypothetical protein